MEYVLNNVRCPECDSLIIINLYRDKEDHREYISHGTCINCLKDMVLPQVEAWSFIKQNCVRF